MKLTADKRRALKRNLTALDKTRLLDGLDRTCTARNAGFGLLNEALESVGLRLSLVTTALNGDDGNILLRIECAYTGDEIDNAGVSYTWQWCKDVNNGRGGYEITAYIS